MEAILIAKIMVNFEYIFNKGELISVDYENNIGFKDNIYFDLFPDEYVLVH